MDKLCKNCRRGWLVGEVRCNFCNSLVDYDTWMQYEKYSFLLTETAGTRWQTVLKSEQKGLLLHPYQVGWKQAGLKLGLVSVTAPEMRRSCYRATVQLLQDLEIDPPASLSDTEKTRLVRYIAAERDLLLLEYECAREQAPLPTAPLSPEKQAAMLKNALPLLEQIGYGQIVNETAQQELLSRYQKRLAEIEAELAAETSRKAEEAAQQRQETQAQVRAELRQRLDAVSPKPEPANPIASLAVAAPKPKKPAKEFKWENVWNALLSEATLRALLYLGALCVVVAAGLFVTLNWKQFPPLLQASMLLGADVLAYLVGLFILYKMKLRRAGLTFITIGAAILPLAIYGYSRPELVDLDNRGTWTWVSLLALPVYLLTLRFIRERLFSYLTCLAALNALWATLYQFGVAPEWLAVAAIPFATGLVWLDAKLRANPKATELASAPFWVGQATVLVTALAIFGYYLNVALSGGNPGESLQWGMGLTWWLATLFYGWCAYRDRTNEVIYHYGTTLAGMVATYLTLQKLPISAEWHGFVMGLLGLGYLAIQNLPDLVERLNDNENVAPWKFLEIFNARKPLNNLGWFLLIGGLSLTDKLLPLAAGMTLLTIALTLATLVYNWRKLAWAAVGAGAFAYILLLVHLKVTQTELGIVLAIAALAGFLLWATVRGSKGRTFYFGLPLEVLAHSAVILMLAFSLGGLSAYNNTKTAWDVTRRDWLLVAALWLVATLLYKRRWFIDGAIGLITLVIVSDGLTITNNKFVATGTVSGVELSIFGLGLAMAGFLLVEALSPNLRKLYALPLGQWGYGLATIGLLMAWNSKPENFLLAVGIYLLMVALAAVAANSGRVAFWAFLAPNNSDKAQEFNRAVEAFWLYPLLGLLPCWLWRALPQLGLLNFGLALSGLAVAYFAGGLALKKYQSPQQSFREFNLFTPAFPALLAWAVTGWVALSLVSGDAVYSLLASAVLVATCALATFYLRDWRFNWLVAGLGTWIAWNGWLLAAPGEIWGALVMALLAVGFALPGYKLTGQYGQPFRVTSHLLAIASFLQAATIGPSWYLTNSLSRKNPQLNIASALVAQLPALLILAALYATLAISRKRPGLFYAVGLNISLLVALASYWLNLSFGLPQLELLAWGYLLTAAITAALYPRLQKHLNLQTSKPGTRNSELGTQHSLSHLAHGWAGLSLLLVSNRFDLLVWLIPATLALYLFRSWHEKRAELIALVTVLGALEVVSVVRWTGAQPSLIGLALIVLAGIYVGLSQLSKSRRSANYDFSKAALILSYSGQLLVIPALLAASQDRFYTLLTLTALTFLASWLARVERTEWSYGAALSGLGAYTMGFWLLGIDWVWFGLALLIPAGSILVAGLLLSKNSQRFVQPSQFFILTAGLLTVLGLPLSWEKDGLMLLHSSILTLLSLIMLRLSKRIEWLYPTIAASCYAGALAIYLLGVGMADYGLALLVLSVVYLAGLFYLARWGTWLDYKARLQGVAVLAATAQGIALAGLWFSWSSDHRLALNLGALLAFYLFNLAVTRWTIWLHAALTTAHLAYLAGLSALFTNGAGLTPVQSGLALLPVGLLLVGFAVRMGQVTGDNLQELTTKIRSRDISLLELGRRKSFPLYAAAGSDLLVSLGLSAGNNSAGLVVAGAIALCLLAVAVWEESEMVAWIALVALALTSWFYYDLARIPLTTLTVGLALVALLLTGLAYLTGGTKGKLATLTRPSRYSSHLVVLAALLLWIAPHAGSNNRVLWDDFSWVLALVGLNYLLVSVLERRRTTSDPAYLRYIGYGGVVLLEAAYIIRLVLGSVSQLQLYVLPVGLMCLGFAWLERDYENQRAAKLLEGLGLTVLLGTGLLQAAGFQTGAIDRTWYGFGLLIESLLIIGFGAGNRLRYYFFGGIAALLVDVLLLVADPTRASDKWVTLGLTGLILISVALFLERKRELVIRVSKDWLQQLKQWQ
jgi:hypothetical protein